MSSSDVERYAFHCDHCDGRWAVEYEVRVIGDGGVAGVRAFFRDGVPVASPRFGLACRFCGGFRVRPSSNVA
jgi:hypothetical protein